MSKSVSLIGAAGFGAAVAAIAFAAVHPMDVAVLALLANGALLLYGIYFLIIFRLRSKGEQVIPPFSHLVLVGGFSLFILIITNLILRNQAQRTDLLSEPLAKVLKMKGVTYEWKRDEFKGENFPEGRVSGVIAQEVEQVLPQLVGTRKDGFKGVAYQEIVPVLIEAVKEQQKLIDRQKQEIEEIKAIVQRMKK